MHATCNHLPSLTPLPVHASGHSLRPAFHVSWHPPGVFFCNSTLWTRASHHRPTAVPEGSSPALKGSPSNSASNHVSLDLASCSNLAEMRGWFQLQLHLGTAGSDQPSPSAAAVAERVAALWGSCPQGDPRSTADLAEVAPLAIAYTLAHSSGLRTRAAVQSINALGGRALTASAVAGVTLPLVHQAACAFEDLRGTDAWNQGPRKRNLAHCPSPHGVPEQGLSL